MTVYRAHEKLNGKEVVSSDGRELGHVKDFEIDTASWKVKGLVIKLNRSILEDVHLRKPFVGSQEIVVSSAHVDALSDKVILTKSLEELGQLTGATDGDGDDVGDEGSETD
jgi:sporulation protein YlmC with PRC-barrel domain